MADENDPPDDAEDNWVQEMADQADAIRTAIDRLEAIALKKTRESPFDPAVQELKDQVEELRRIYPRID
jgi:hypothetical protein